MPGEDILLTLGIDLTNIDQVASQINSRLQSQANIGTQISQQKDLVALSQEQAKANNLLTSSITTKQKADAQGIITTEAITKFTKERVKVEQSLGDQLLMVGKRALLWGTVWSLAYGAIRSVQNIVQDTIKTFIDLDTQLTSLSIVTDVTRAQFGELRTEFFDVAKSMGRDVADVAGAVQIFAQQGMSISESMELARISMIGTNITGVATQEMAENLTAAFRAFNIPVNESVSILDKLVAVANKTAIEMPELSGAIQRVGSTSQAVGVSLDDLLGYVAAIGEVTRRSGAEIGRALRTIFIRTLTDTNDALLMANAGITIYANTAKTQFRPLGDVLAELSVKWDDMGEVQQKVISEALAGQRQYDMFTALMQNFDRAVFATKASANSAGDAMEAMRKKADSLEFQINTLKTSFKELFVEGVGGGEQTFRNLITSANNFVTSLKEINDFINQNPALRALFGITQTPTQAPSTAGTISGTAASGGLAAILGGVLTKAVPVTGALPGIGVGIAATIGIKSLFDFYNTLFGLVKDLEVEVQATIALAEQESNFLEQDRLAREKAMQAQPAIFATFPMAMEDIERINELNKEIKDLTKEQTINLNTVDLLKNSYQSLGIFFNSNKEKLGIYQKNVSEVSEKIAELDIFIAKNRENLAKQIEVFKDTKTAEESLKIYSQAVELQELLNNSLLTREELQKRLNDLLNEEKKTRDEILAKDLQEMNIEHQISMAQIQGMSDYQIALMRAQAIKDGLIEQDRKELAYQEAINDAIQARAQELTDIEAQIRSTLESGFVDILKGESSPSEVLQSLGDIYLEQFAKRLFSSTGMFGGLITGLAEAGMEIKDPMQAAIVEGSKTGAEYFYNAITLAGMNISGVMGGSVATGGGLPSTITGLTSLFSGMQTRYGGTTGDYGPYMPQASNWFANALAGGLAGMSTGGGMPSFAIGAMGSIMGSMFKDNSAFASWFPIIGTIIGMAINSIGGSEYTTSPAQTEAPTAEGLSYAAGNFTYERPYILPESAYFGGREGTTRPIVDNSITIDLSGAEIVGLDSTDVAEKIVDTIDRKLSTKYYRQVNERGMMNTYPR